MSVAKTKFKQNTVDKIIKDFKNTKLYTKEFLKSLKSGLQESSSGNSFKDFKKMWQGKSINQIHKEILNAKKAGEI